MVFIKMNKKGVAAAAAGGTGMIGAALIALIPFFLIVTLGGTATLKFLFMDKTPLILGGILVILFLLKRRRGG